MASNQTLDQCRQGLLLEEAERYHEAIAVYLEASRSNPSSALPHIHIALCAMLLDEFGLAEEHALKALELDPTDPASHFCVARVSMFKEDFQSAVVSLEAAIALSPKSANTWSSLGICFRRLNDFEKSQRSFRAAVELSPDKAIYKIRLARVQMALGDFSVAIENLLEAQENAESEEEKLLITGYLKHCSGRELR